MEVGGTVVVDLGGEVDGDEDEDGGVEVEVEVEVDEEGPYAETLDVVVEVDADDTDEYPGFEMPNWAVYWYAWVSSTMSSMP